MDRRTFLAALGGSVIVTPVGANAQPARGIPTIAFLGPPLEAGGMLPAFQQGLADLGYVDGKNVKVEYRFNVAIQGNVDRLKELAAELVALRPDVFVVSLSEVALVAKNATSTIPIVMANAADPVAAGLVASLAHPGGNVTGVSRQTPQLVAKQLQLLKEILPRTSRVGLLLSRSGRLESAIVEAAQRTAASLGMQISAVTATTTAEIEQAFSNLRSLRADAVVVSPGGVFYLSRAQIADLALKHRLASIFGYREAVAAGGLMSYGENSSANYHRAAYFVDKILKGAKPADLPVEQPVKFEFVINRKTAKALGVAIPQTLLVRADELVE
jgi:putative ABC transport system substrate-binding protein